MSRCCCLLAICWQVSLWVPADLQGQDDRRSQGRIGQQIASFHLKDYRGTEFQLDDLRDSKLVVVAFLGTECPLVELYGPRLQQLSDQYADQSVSLIGINSNAQDNVTEIATFVRKHAIRFTMLKDVGNRIADQFGAARTPEVFVLDPQRRIQYRGRIDDQFGIGFQRPAAQVRDLNNAIDELLAGKDVSQPNTDAVGCQIGRIKQPKADAEITWCNQIVRILQHRCVACHREGEIGPFALTDYNEVAGWADMIEEVVRENRMPPWNANPDHGSFANAAYLSDQEKQALYQWVADGAPEGDPADLPAAREFVSGWQLTQHPDYVATITEQPFTIKADGIVSYQYFTVDPGFREDKWISAAQLLPGNHRVVHHILALIVPPGEEYDDIGELEGFLVGYVPGLFVQPFPAGMAKRIAAGSKLVFQVHYTPIGSEQTDQSRLGLVFADPEEITHEVVTTSGIQQKLRIPPHDDSYRVQAKSHRPLDGALLLGFMPHMHLRGKSFRYEIRIPSIEQDEILLDVPRYDFNWQHAYRLTNPREMPIGTSIRIFAEFDNSANNPHNPDPSATVRWGDQTYEEMMIGYFDIAVPMEDEIRNYSTKTLIQAQGIIDGFDRNQDGKITIDEVPYRTKEQFRKFDLNGDGEVFAREAAAALSR